jgi:hypothetical protein
MKKNSFISFLLLFFLNVFSQVDSSLAIIFDFNTYQIKEKNNKVIPKFEGVTLTADRFGNNKSAVYIHGNISSYLNLGTSTLLKPKNGTISLWVNLDRKVYAGKGYKSNPIITTKNGPGEDFISAYSIIYDCNANRLVSVFTKDSLKEAIIASIDSFSFGKWYHLAVTFDSCYMSFYINGELQQKIRKNFETTYLSTDPVMVGHSGDKKNERFSQGVFDDIMIFHRVLTQQEIIDLYKSPNPNQNQLILNEVLKYGGIILFFIILIVVIQLRNKKNASKQKERLELINKISELELKVIKAQINPHFISNCLAAIQELIYSNQVDKAGYYVAKFSYFLRQVLNYSDKNQITLAQEIEIMKLNVELEQLRFKNEFDFQLNLADNIDATDILVPALITQPFIENAIWHGLLPLNNSRKPQLIINVLKQNGFPVIEIEDNGVRRDLTKLTNRNSKGMKLILDKIENLNKLLNSSNYQIEIIDLIDELKNKTGTKIKIRLDNIQE